jgi:membrane associated rhomboid family serine protease
MRTLHADALKLKRWELIFVLPVALLSIATVIATAVFPRELWVVGVSVVPVLLYTGRWTVEWVRLRRSNPLEHFHRDRRADAEQAAGVADYRARATANKPVATLSLVAGIGGVSVAAFMASGMESSVAAAGLVKALTRDGQWWRMLTASYLHVNVTHLLGTVGVLVLLGEMIEAYDRRLRVPLAYLAGVLGGSFLSLLLVDASSIGASGGVLGLAGYLLVFTYRRSGAGSLWLRRQVAGIVASAAVIGLIGFLVIDNAAHLGGLLAGACAGLAAIPRDGVDNDPRHARAVESAGWAAAAVLAAGAVLTLSRLLG